MHFRWLQTLFFEHCYQCRTVVLIKVNGRAAASEVDASEAWTLVHEDLQHLVKVDVA
jgi:hypothetical protein